MEPATKNDITVLNTKIDRQFEIMRAAHAEILKYLKAAWLHGHSPS